MLRLQKFRALTPPSRWEESLPGVGERRTAGVAGHSPSLTLPHVVSKTRLRHDGGGNPRAVRIAALRQAVARLETAAPGAEAQHLPLGVPEMQAHLPGPGLACGVLHEVAAAAHGDRPAAFGFLFALTAAALRSRPGPAVLVATRRALAGFRQALRPRPRPARPRRRPAPHRRDRAPTRTRSGRSRTRCGPRPGRPWSPARSRAISISPPAAG